MSPSVIQELDRILFEHDSDPLFLIVQQQDDLHQKALKMGEEYDLFHIRPGNIELKRLGYEVIRAGGFEKWYAKSQNSGSGGFLNIESNTPNITQPVTSPKKKSEHTIWDKIKYISVIFGGLCALILAIGKALQWF